ncbi:hypothetical protein ACFSRY_15925 [Pontibacter locisalis]|uniref:Acyl carrier protein n=1 Tax=Pontibacter locisalis TaxID=1719035 RepID=A0ABW5INY9_9BACT
MKEVSPEKLDRANTLNELNLDMMDMVDIIFEIEKVYSIYIPDNAQIFTVNDVVDYIVKQNLE